MEDLTLTQEQIDAITTSYNEWSLSRSKEKTEKEQQKDIIEAIVDLTELSKSDVLWMFKAREDTDKTKEQQEVIDNRLDLFNVVFGNSE